MYFLSWACSECNKPKANIRDKPKTVYISRKGRKGKEEMIQTGCCISGHKVGSVSHSIRHALLSQSVRNCLLESFDSTFQSYLVQCLFKGCSERPQNEALNGGACRDR